MQALIPALLMNVYIVGLNQIYDIDIDKVNKPYLPLASGEFSFITGIALVTICAALVRFSFQQTLNLNRFRLNVYLFLVEFI